MLAQDQNCLSSCSNVFHRPIIPLLLALVGGIVLGTRVVGYGWLAVTASLAGLIFMLWMIRRSASALLWPLILFLSLGYIVILPWVSPPFDANHISAFLDTGPWKVTGVAVDRPLASGGRIRLVLEVQQLSADGVNRPVEGKLRLTVYGQAPPLAAGDRIVFRGRIRSIRNFNNPGGFDYRRHMAFQGIHATSSVAGKRLSIIEHQPPARLQRWTNAYRSSAAALIDRAGNSPQRDVLKALILGDRSAVDQTMRESFNRAGVSHILAISGLHIGIIATVFFLVFQKSLGFVKLLLWRAWTRKTAALLTLVPVIAYGWVSGWSPSTQRAVLMVTVFLLSFLYERDSDTLNSIALAALLILIVHPPALFSISFQLSFAAVLAMYFGMTRLKAANIGMERHGPARVAGLQTSTVASFPIKAGRWAIQSFFVSLFAIWGTLPLVMYYFNQFSVAGLFTNLIVIPLIGFMVIPLGIMALFLLPLTASGASGCLMIADGVLALAIRFIEWTADVPFLSFRTVSPTVFEIALFFAFSWALLNINRSDSPDAAVHPPKRRFHVGRFHLQPAAVLLLVAVGAAGCADAGYWLYQRYWHRTLRITAIDVGQGTASLLELPGGYTLMIDGGGFSDNEIFDVGARVIAPYLWRKKIRQIDLLVLSHPNSDHLNGLIYIAGHFNVREIWTNGETRKTYGYRELMRVVDANHIHRPRFSRLPDQCVINGVKLEILYPPKDFHGRGKVDKWRNSNNNSLILRVSYGRHSFLFPGDIMHRAEEELLVLQRERLRSTVLMAPHHGSRSSSCEPFLEAVAPDSVVVSAGWNNRFGFPHRSVLERYAAMDCRLWRTDRNGAIVFTTDGSELVATPFISESR